MTRRSNACSRVASSPRSLGNLAGSGSSPTQTRLPLLSSAALSLWAKLWGTAHDTKASQPLGSMLALHRESRIAQQDSYWTAIGSAAGKSPRRAPYQHQCAETILRHRRCVGTLAAAAMPLAQDSFAASAAALSLGPSTPALRHAARKSRAHSQHSVLADGRAGTQGSGVGLGTCTGGARTLRWRQPALLHAGKWT